MSLPIEATMTRPIRNHRWTTVALLAGILLLAMNLRAPFTGLAPVLPWIQSDFLLSTAAVGALTSLPLLAFAVFSPFSASIAHRFGIEKTLFAALVIIAIGIGVRSSGYSWLLYAGTALIGVGISLGNVLLPSLIKRDFPRNMPSMTGAYSIAMGLGGAVGSALVIPLTQVWGWKYALTAFALIPLVTILAWLPQLTKEQAEDSSFAQEKSSINVWRSALAWQVTLFMGFNAMIFYIAIGWLPTILIDQGTTAATAGSMHGVLQLATAIPGLILAAVLRRMVDQRPAAVVVSLLSAISFFGLLYLPSLAIIWSALLGFGSGASMMLGLTFIGLRTSTTKEAAALSGMAQGVGYLLAAAAPMVLGALHDWLGSWHVPLMLASAVAVLGAWMGMLAGRNRNIGATSLH